MKSSRWFLALSLLLVVGGCGKDDAPAPDQSASRAQPEAAKEEPKTPLVPKREAADWCREHGVPESVCTRCNESLVEQFKESGDWCDGHGLPESQCTACNPELVEKFKAMAPK